MTTSFLSPALRPFTAVSFSRFFLVITGFIMFCNAQAQDFDDFSFSEFEEDYQVFREALLCAHPGLYIHRTPSEVAAMLPENLEGDFDNYSDFYRHLSVCLEAFEDGHTSISPGKNEDLDSWYDHCVPIQVSVQGNGLWVEKSFSPELELSSPVKLQSINGVSGEEILQRMRSLISADGGNSAFKDAYIEAVFPHLFPMAFDVYSYDYEVSVGGPSLLLRSIPMSDMNEAEIPAQLDFEIENGIATLGVASFLHTRVAEGGQEFNEFMLDAFKQIRKESVDTLYIDLRGNVGGDNILAVNLMRFLVEDSIRGMAPSIMRDFASCDQEYWSSTDRFRDRYYPENVTSADEITANPLIEEGILDPNNLFMGPGRKAKSVKKLKYKGPIVILTDGLTFSASSNFCGMIQQRNKTELRGVIGGAVGTQFCGGAFIHITLPNSGFSLRIPTLRRKVL